VMSIYPKSGSWHPGGSAFSFIRCRF